MPVAAGSICTSTVFALRFGAGHALGSTVAIAGPGTLTTIGGAVYDPPQLAEAAYTGCGPKPPKRPPVPFAFAPTFPACPPASGCSASRTAM
jgi:hypothetical protein